MLQFGHGMGSQFAGASHAEGFLRGRIGGIQCLDLFPAPGFVGCALRAAGSQVGQLRVAPVLGARGEPAFRLDQRAAAQEGVGIAALLPALPVVLQTLAPQEEGAIRIQPAAQARPMAN